MPDDHLLSDDLLELVDTLRTRANVCRLVSTADLVDLLPRRAITEFEAQRLLAVLAAAELEVLESDAVERLQRGS